MALEPLCQRLVHLLEFLELLFSNLIVVKDLNIVLRDGLDLAFLILRQVLCGELIDWVVKDENFVALLDILLEDWTALNRVKRVSREIQDGVLVFLHS